MSENLETLTEAELERMLLEATTAGVPGRTAMARVTAIRTLLRRRQEHARDTEADARRALELVNASRGPGEQLTEVHPVWVASILAEPEWAELYVADEESPSAMKTEQQSIGGGRSDVT